MGGGLKDTWETWENGKNWKNCKQTTISPGNHEIIGTFSDLNIGEFLNNVMKLT